MSTDVPRFRMSGKLPREATPRAFESIEKEFERVYQMMRGLADQGDASSAAIDTLGPADAQYLVGAAVAGLPNARVVTNTATISWDLGTVGQAKANVIDASITDAKLRNSSALSVIGRASNSVGSPADIVAASASTVLRRNAVNQLEFAKADVSVDIQGRLPYANLTAATAAARLLGRGSASAGDWQEILATYGLVISGTSLRTTEGGVYYSPLTDSDLTEPELVFTLGDVIMVPVYP